jgi:hypothetical protein
MSGDSELEDFIARVRSLGTASEDVAKAAVPGVLAVVKESAAAGRSPNGAAWAAGKDGGRVLANAASAVDCRAIGSTVQLRIVGNATGDQKAQSIQHWGSKRIPARPILPEAGASLPKPIVGELTRAAQHYFKRSMGGQ